MNFLNSKRGSIKSRLEHIEKIPGQFGDRRTMLGELNQIFTAIPDTIAWNILPRDTFQKLIILDLFVDCGITIQELPPC